MYTNNNMTPGKNYMRGGGQEEKINHQNGSRQPSSETSKQFSYNNSYYEISKQQYKTKTKKETMSDLSVLIYEGLQTAKIEVYQNNWLIKMEQAYKKQLQLQIQQCKQLQGLTMMSILKDKQGQILQKQNNIEFQIANIKEQLGYIQRKLKPQNSDMNLVQQKSCQSLSKPNTFTIVRKANGKAKMQKLCPNDIQQNTYQTSIHQNSLENQAKEIHFNKIYQSQNLSTIPSRGSSFSNYQLIGTPSSSPNHLNEKKLLLFKRRNLMKDELKLAERNFQQKTQMIKSEISLLKKQLSIINQNIDKVQTLEVKKRSLTPFKGNTQSKLREKSRNPRLTSQGSKKNQRTLGFKNQKKGGRPSMFHNKKIQHFSPTIYRCTSENKIGKHIFNHPIRFLSQDQQKLPKARSNMQEARSTDDYLYFTNKRQELATQSKCGTNRRKNIYNN